MRTSSTVPGGCFFNGDSPAAVAPHRGKKMQLAEIDVERLQAPYTHDGKMEEEAAKLTAARGSFDRLGESDAPPRGKKMFGEGSHKANAYLFVEYGSFPPPAQRPYGQVRNPSDDELRSLIHPGHEIARLHEVEKIGSSPSVFNRNFENGQLHGFFRPPKNAPQAAPLSVKRAQRGLLDAIVEKGDKGQHAGKKMLHEEHPQDPKPIPGFSGVGVGQVERFDRIQSHEKVDMMPPMQPHFGTHHDAKYGVHGFTTCPPAPPENERNGWFNWTEDRQKCPVTDAGFDPLALKEDFCSPGDPLNHPQRLKRIDLGTPQTTYLMRNEPGHPSKRDTTAQCVKMFPPKPSPREVYIPGFHGLGDPDREARNDRPRGMRKLEPVHEVPRRAKSSLDYYH